MKRYSPQDIEPKWQKVWADTKLYAAVDGDPRPKYYMLTEFPYPSGDGLHAGHAREYTLGDVISRHKRMQGHNVLYPMGYDAFGLPTENYAIKHKIRPQDATAQNVANFRQQFEALGYSFDWDREVNTTDPDYYKWTQWLFLRFLEKGLAYQAEMPINWCPKEKTGLANEEVVNGVHERCGTPVEKKLLKQWMLGITKYADRLIEGLKTVDYPPRIADQQVNWIGRSEGAEIEFAVGQPLKTKDALKFTPELTTLIQNGTKTNTIRLEAKDLQVGDFAKFITRYDADTTRAFAVAKITQVRTLPLKDIPVELAGHGAFTTQDEMLDSYRGYYGPEVSLDTDFTVYDFEVAQPIITVFTTRPDTLGGATFMVLAPEHPAVPAITTLDQRDAVEHYIKQAQRETDLDRQAEDRPKTGVATGAYATNPINGEQMPIWIADYVLAGYGTGAIMAVPAHDTRDFAFAKAHELPVRIVIEPVTGTPQPDPEFRRSIVAIVRRPDTGELLTVNWGAKHGGHLFIGGGIDDGEHYEAAARREIAEETGYRNLRLVAQTERIHHDYFAHSKGKQRHIEAHGFYFELENDERTEPQRQPDEKFKVEWLAADQAERQVVEELHAYVFRRLVRGEVYTGYGKLVGSGDFNGLEGTSAKKAIVEHLFKQGIGRGTTQYKLRDWIFSRQHYWGEPIPVIHCPKDGVVPVPADQLPVTLPEVEHYEPTDTGESPLAAITDWVNTKCPTCGGDAKRETDTMPNWAGSSWYWLRYTDPKNDNVFADPDKLKYWGPVDLYLGGMEHTTLHLLYSRFWHQFLFDEGLVPTPEPYAARRGQGIVLASDGRKMSKSLGNVINPNDIIARYGADSFRLYIMFMAPFDETTPWSDERLNGVSRFLYRTWTLAQDLIANATPSGTPDGTFATLVDRATHKTIKKVHDDFHELRFNTTVSALMEYVNFLTEAKTKAALTDPANADLAQRTVRTLILLLAPATPHIAEELWEQAGNDGSVHIAPWPAYDPELIKDDVFTIAVQVNGKLRGQVAVAADATEDEVKEAAQADDNVAKHLEGAHIIKTIVVPRKLVNFVIK
jgi:leucyl-tRNA synthetase